ncbi:hypothetical protein ACHAQJ_001282 [Trichoderma viride]
MSDTSSQVRCRCGKNFKNNLAMMQHVRDSPRHLQRNSVPPPALDERLTCSCGSVFNTVQALQQHERDSPLHGGGASNGQRVNDALPSAGSPSLWQRPIPFVRAGTEAKNTKRARGSKSKTGSTSGNRGIWSDSGTWYPDVGDNHALCDKDCGWCGHCAEGVDF